MSKVSVRYIVDDVEAAKSFYQDMLGFELDMSPGRGFALLSKGPLRLLLNEPGSGGAGETMQDGTAPSPGGWNRIQLQVEDLAAEIDRLEKAGAQFRNRLVEGRGGRQILLADPSGNLIELFEPKR